MICQEHDLSVYTANYQETCTALNDSKHQGLIWEGQGLLSWIIKGPDSPSVGDKTIQGKHVDAKVHGGDDHIQVHIELQPVRAHTCFFFSYIACSFFTCTTSRGPYLNIVQ